MVQAGDPRGPELARRAAGSEPAGMASDSSADEWTDVGL